MILIKRKALVYQIMCRNIFTGMGKGQGWFEVLFTKSNITEIAHTVKREIWKEHHLEQNIRSYF